MNLISCEECGVVIDKDRYVEPEIFGEDGTVNMETAIWEGNDFIPVIKCPVCKNKVPWTKP